MTPHPKDGLACMLRYSATPRLPQMSNNKTARHWRLLAARCVDAPTRPNNTKRIVAAVRGIVGDGVGPNESATCQSAYSNQLASCSQSGALRGQRPGTSYCRRATTSARETSVDGLP